MFGTLKKLFSKSAQTATIDPVAPRVPARPAFAPTSAPAAMPGNARGTEMAAAVPAGAQAKTASDAITIPLAAILQKLPGSLTALGIKTAGVTFALPAGTALQQLSSGKVRIPFGQVRKQVPFGTFADNETHDAVIIELPLSPILAGMSPGLLARRAQKRIEVPDEVVGVFGPKGTISARVAQDVRMASAAPPAPVAEAVPIAPTPISPAPTPVMARTAAVAPAPVAAPTATPVKTAGPIRVRIAAKPAAAAVVAAPAPEPIPVPEILVAAPVIPAVPVAKAPVPITPIAPAPKAAAPASNPLPFARRAETTAAAPTRLPSLAKPTIPSAPAVKPAPVVAQTETDIVAVPLSDISDGFPDPVRQEIARGEWDLAMVMFPASRLEPGMKAGRLAFTWGEVRQWLNPPIGSIPSQHIDVPVELPLKVVAPLFLGARRVAGQRKMEIDETIPDVFTNLKPGAAQARPAPAGHTPAAAAAPVEEETVEAPAPAPVPMAPAPVSHVPRPDGLGTIFGQPLKSEWSPAEITQKISEWNGISGALLTMADGLLVAGQVAPPQNAERVAAFLPQIFSRLNQYAGEMQLGTLSGVTLITPEGPCTAYKAGRLYLGVMGRAGQSLPEMQLLRIASEIAKRNP